MIISPASLDIVHSDSQLSCLLSCLLLILPLAITMGGLKFDMSTSHFDLQFQRPAPKAMKDEEENERRPTPVSSYDRETPDYEPLAYYPHQNIGRNRRMNPRYVAHEGIAEEAVQLRAWTPEEEEVNAAKVARP